MHVFIDTNILLKFFHFTEDELSALSDVFATHKHGSASVHLTEQVRDEFSRNREGKIKDALKRFREVKLAPQLPAFLKGYKEYGEIRSLSKKLQDLQKTLLETVHADIAAKDLLADRLLGEILKASSLLAITDDVFGRASRRVALGNPPGKSGSLGDAVNWELLLASLPQHEDVHLISEDGDFYSQLEEDQPHGFLFDEWRDRKNGVLYVYRTLSAFMREHFDGVAFSFDKEKEALIDALAESGTFAETHELVAKLENYSYFSAREVIRIMQSAVQNSQFSYIITDADVASFLNRIAVPQMAHITSEDQLFLLRQAITRQQEGA